MQTKKLITSTDALRLFLFAFVLVSGAGPSLAQAGIWEVSTGFWFNRSNYSDSNFTWTRRIGASVAYYFTESSGIEASYQDAVSRTKVVDEPSGFIFQDTTYDDKIYSLNWIQNLMPRTSQFQPFLKGGVAQLNRDISGTFYNTPSKVIAEDTLTFVGSVGFKFYFSQRIALRGEVTSYISEGGLQTWTDNLAGTVGLSVFF